MNRLLDKLVDAFLASHNGVLTKSDALGLGISSDQIKWQLRTGRWAAVHRNVYRRAGEPVSTACGLAAACLAGGPRAVASHASAAWLWELTSTAPARPEITVPRNGVARLVGVTVHRSGDVDASRIIVRQGIRVTDPLRTLADLGRTVRSRELEDAVDRAVATGLVSVQGLVGEVERLQRPGRRGVRHLQKALSRRSMVAPAASVLESRTLRLLRGWGVTPVGIEVQVCDGRYRLDFLLAPGVALEVDGYAYHWSPDAKAADSLRRNQLRLAGITVVEADWTTVMREPATLRSVVEAALGAVGPARTRNLRPTHPKLGPHRSQPAVSSRKTPILRAGRSK